MNLVFIGTSQFGMRCLHTCLDMKFLRIVGVVSAPQSFAISYRPEGVKNIMHADIANLARSRGIPEIKLKRTMKETELLEAIAQWKPDAFLVAGWYHMIPRSWRKIAPAYGLHASLLPDYSGGAPLVWAMINGESKTGITMFQMDDGVDSGLIAGQKEESILPDDTIGTLYSRVEDRAQELLIEVLPQLADGTLKLRPQDERQRRVFPQRSPEDGWIDWTQDSADVERFIRSQTRPYPDAYTSFLGKPMHIWRASANIQSSTSSEPGRIRRTEKERFLISCGNKSLELREISFEGHTYDESQLVNIFGKGGQILGSSRECPFASNLGDQ